MTPFERLLHVAHAAGAGVLLAVIAADRRVYGAAASISMTPAQGAEALTSLLDSARPTVEAAVARECDPAADAALLHEVLGLDPGPMDGEAHSLLTVLSAHGVFLMAVDEDWTTKVGIAGTFEGRLTALQYLEPFAELLATGEDRSATRD